MGTGILLCGLNGSGKSTLGAVLADRLGFHFMDSEALFFAASDTTYAAPRSRTEAVQRLMDEIHTHGDFVLAAVTGNYGPEVSALYRCVVRLDVPREIRLQRIRARSIQKFGDRAQPGGDLYEREKSFWDMAASRTECTLDDWIQRLHCPVLRIDGTMPIDQNVAYLVTRLQKMPGILGR